MTNSNHTPGPWYVNGDTFDVERMDGTFIGSKRIVARCATGEGAMENACLISAAPDLLDALKTFVAEYVELVESGDAGNWNPETEAKVIAARAAIAKAEGKA